MWVSDLVPPWKNKKVGVYYYGDVRKFKNIDNCGEREDNKACKKQRFFFAEMNESKFEYQQPTIRDSNRGNRITKVSLAVEITEWRQTYCPSLNFVEESLDKAYQYSESLYLDEK